ncbi:hypothetical protein RJT34_25373 [Clitoria ternatea]|uniref:Uncharacterized protein n=1 Tax=Clitoria ternatea TaxID=43366 RepID=A0AAN9FPW1_CLITE
MYHVFQYIVSRELGCVPLDNCYPVKIMYEKYAFLFLLSGNCSNYSSPFQINLHVSLDVERLKERKQ